MVLPASHLIDRWLTYNSKTTPLSILRITHQEPDPNDPDAGHEDIVDEIDTVKIPPDEPNAEYAIKILVQTMSHGLFCSGHSFLPDGKLLIVGGSVSERTNPFEHHHGHPLGPKEATIFDPDGNTWSAVEPMKHGRWYPSTLLLGDGNVFVMDGHTDTTDPLTDYMDDDGGSEKRRHSNTDREIWLSKTNRWHYEPAANATIARDGGWSEYPRLHLLPNGDVFCSSKIFAIPRFVEEVIQDGVIKHSTVPGKYFDHGVTALYRPTTKAWQVVVSNGPEGGTNGSDTFDTSVLLPLMYPEYEAKILIFDSVNFFKISPLSVTPKWNEVPNRPLNQVQRKNLNGVILPDGTIFFVGGWSKGLTWDSGVPVYEPEIYDPFDATQPWQQGAPMKGNRGYHSTAILMYDGRVLVGGGEPRGDNSHHFEIYTPDCLLRGPRPAFSLYANIVTYGQRITIKLGGDWKYKHLHPERIALVRCASVTHAFSFDQRYVNVQPRRKTRRYIKNKAGDFELPLDPVSRIAKLVDEPLPAPEADDTEFEIEIPSHSNLLPPGYYFLFLMSKLDDGSPGCASLAQIIQIT